MIPDDDNMEKALRAALRREAAPVDFASTVLAKTRAPLPFPQPVIQKPQSKWWLQRRFTLVLAAGLAIVAIVPAVVLEHEHTKELAEEVKAKRDLLTALAITKDQFKQAREKVRRTTRKIQ
jgi:hypothetical protein